MQSNREIRVVGRAVSRGVAVGTILCLYGAKRQFFRRSIKDDEIDLELEKLDHAFVLANERLAEEIERSLVIAGPALAEILETHRAFLSDPAFRSRIIETLRTERRNVEWSISVAGDAILSRISEFGDKHLREKALDIEDVCDRLLKCLTVDETELVVAPNTIIAAREVSPSMLLNLANGGIIGLISESGGWTSHTSIFARELGIPAVAGIADIFNKFEDGIYVYLDGFKGEVVLHPRSDKTIVRSDLNTYAAGSKRLDDTRSDPGGLVVATRDGHEITIRTNTTSVEAYQMAARAGARGIGLYRSETLIDIDGAIPDEDRQFAAYRAIADAVGGDGVRIRTFDLDADKFEPTSALRQKNPALGLRAVRLGIEHEGLLTTQIRALLRSAYGRRIGLVVPMVSGIPDLILIRELVKQASAELDFSQIEHGDLELGAMIEVPSSVLVADQLLQVCDFLCLGTNDLAQYLLAADRDNELVARWFRTLHPAMLRAVRSVISESRKANKPLTVCGEMAGSPFYVPVLVGMGATELSMNPSSIAGVLRVISGITLTEANELVESIEKLGDPKEIEAIVAETARVKWADSFPPGFLDMQKS